MRYKDLAKKAREFGYQFPAKKNAADANKTLAEIANSGDIRFLEAFPGILANAAETGKFDAAAVIACLKPQQNDVFKALMLMSAALYLHLGLRFNWAQTAVAGFARGALADYIAKFKENGAIKIGTELLQAPKVRASFLASFQKNEEALRSAAADREQLGLEYALARIFPPGQKRLFLKKLRGESMTKTEKEYFSRIIKKKALALANEDLHRMAIKVLE